jgi:hypothetical protein
MTAGGDMREGDQFVCLGIGIDPPCQVMACGGGGASWGAGVCHDRKEQHA